MAPFVPAIIFAIVFVLALALGIDAGHARLRSLEKRVRALELDRELERNAP